MKSKPDSKAEQRYFVDEDSDLTLKYHTTRTAESHASWFLPYLQPGMVLLDCGCASGSITIGLAKRAHPGQVTGIDVSEIEIERAKKRAAENNITNIRFEVSDLCQLNYSDNSFDVLFCHHVLEHIPEPDKALREMFRVLKPGGIIGVRDTDMGGMLVTPDDELVERWFVLHEAYWINVGGHPRLGRQLGKLLTETGFNRVEMSASYYVYDSLEKRRFIAPIMINRLGETGFFERTTSRGLTNVEELENIKKALLAWQEFPCAIFAHSQCEAIGRKP
jgi:ubiquinone/menaquinone biosynthesis C-methylase UbiE